MQLYGILFASANFPADPTALEVINITETSAIDTIAECEAVSVAISRIYNAD